MQKISLPEKVTVSRKGVAARWSCSVETVKRREAAGVLKALKLGRLVRYRLADVEAAEAEAEVVR
jgi:hypothetical protein